MSITLKVVTCNARKELHGSAPEQVVATVRDLDPEVIGFQEIETDLHCQAVNALVRHGYAVFWPGGAADACPIAYKLATFPEAKVQRSRQTHRGQRGLTPNRYIVWLVLVDRDGDTWPFLNTHMMTPCTDRRWRAHARIMRRRLAILRRRWGRVVMMGDVNRSKWAPSGFTGLWANEGTHGPRRYLDLLAIAGRIASVGGVVRVQTASDHDVLVARLEATER